MANLYGKSEKHLLDRRVQKTRQLLQDALIALIAEQGYESVTVQEILDKANVGRSTFYAHFQDKEQLLRSCFDGLNELFERRTQQLSKAEQKSRNQVNANLTLDVFQFVGRNHRFFKALLGKQSNGLFNKIIYNYVLTHAREHLKFLVAHEKNGSYQAEIVVHYFVSAFIGVLVWCVEQDMP